LDLVAEDLGELADILHSSGQRIAFEFMSWSTAAPTWRNAWEIVRKADRPNLGICIDTFHIVAIEWADPTTASGQLEDPNAVEKFNRSLERLTAEIAPDKIFSIQLGDAYKLQSPADPEKLTWPPLLYWAGHRTKPSMGLGFLPVDQVTDAILKTGFVGPISIECFDGGRDGKTPPAGSALEQAKFLSESWDKSITAHPEV
jgi:sugar phosphate isomerase/epimerase